MAIGIPIIRANDVAQAYTQDLTPLAGLVQNVQRQGEIQRREKNERDAQSAALLSTEIESLNTPTGTPFDDYVNGQMGSILEGYKSFMKQNPNASLLSQKQFMYGQTAKLKNQMAMAKMLDKNIETTSAYLEKQYPSFDPIKLREGMKRAVWYNADGSLKAPDKATFDAFVAGLDNDDNFRKYTDPTALGATALESMNKFYPEQGQHIPVQGSPFYWDADLRSYERLDTSTGKRYIPAEEKEIEGQRIKMLSKDLYGSIAANNREFRLMTLDTADRLKAANPELRNLDADDLNRIAANSILNDFGIKSSRKAPIQRISDVEKWNRTLQRDAISDMYRARADQRASTRFAERHQSESKKTARKYSASDFLQDLAKGKDVNLEYLSEENKVKIPVLAGGKSITDPNAYKFNDGYRVTDALKNKHIKIDANHIERLYVNPTDNSFTVEKMEKTNGRYEPVETRKLTPKAAQEYFKLHRSQLSQQKMYGYEETTTEIQDVEETPTQPNAFLPTINIDFSNAPD